MSESLIHFPAEWWGVTSDGVRVTGEVWAGMNEGHSFVPVGNAVYLIEYLYECVVPLTIQTTIVGKRDSNVVLPELVLPSTSGKKKLARQVLDRTGNSTKFSLNIKLNSSNAWLRDVRIFHAVRLCDDWCSVQVFNRGELQPVLSLGVAP